MTVMNQWVKKVVRVLKRNKVSGIMDGAGGWWKCPVDVFGKIVKFLPEREKENRNDGFPSVADILPFMDDILVIDFYLVDAPEADISDRFFIDGIEIKFSAAQRFISHITSRGCIFPCKCVYLPQRNSFHMRWD